jgi:uncharacterized protein DUF1566
MRHGLIYASGLVALGILMLPARGAEAQTTAVGPYYATPSWNQTLACTAPASCPRFVVLSNFNSDAVLDRETGLVWERSPDTTELTWREAQFHCISRAVSNRYGWRLPHIQELASLIDPSVNFLPAGHPFSVVQGRFYWSGTDVHDEPFNAWVAILGGNFGVIPKSISRLAWCVRGGQGADGQ